MSNSKLHPIYTALEGQQYNRAIKLCLAQPSTNLVTQALLAHAYGKSEQKYKALATIQSILGHKHCQEFFPELRLAIKYCVDGKPDITSTATPAPVTNALASSGKKGGKKGKKKGPVSTTPAKTVSDPEAVKDDWDLVEYLEKIPELPPDWDKLPPPKDAILDETLLSTLSMTMVSALRLPLTSYQIHCWAAAKADNEEFILRKAFLAGFAVLVAPQYEHIVKDILANMQVLAVQLARVQQQTYGIAPSTSWAAQTALWQLNIPSQDPQKMAMLPRLAESLAAKCVYEIPSTDRLTATEDFLLYIRALESQHKNEEKLKALQKKLDDADEHMMPPRQTVLHMKAVVLVDLKRFSKAREVLEALLDDYPDDWRYWIQHLECSMGDSSNVDMTNTAELIESILQKKGDEKYPLRGPRLMKVEIAKRKLEQSLASNAEKDTADALLSLVRAIIQFGKELAGKCTCVYSDLAPYLDILFKYCDLDTTRSFLEWSKGLRVPFDTNDPKESRMQLRTYIFGVNVLHRILVEHEDFVDTELPPWQDYVKIWKKVKDSESSDQAQKESRPADDLILLAVHQLLYKYTDKGALVSAACLLESAIRWSPYNAYLKITAMLVYGELNAVSRSWTLFKELQIKHIQHESCAYFILPLLLGGGFYREVISFCQEILRLQINSVRDASDFASRAMENGTRSKAEEFVEFQRNRMNKSLVTLEAKGFVLDCASMYVTDEKQDVIGAVQGIVGGDLDVERACKMVASAHDPCGAFSLLNLGNHNDEVVQLSDFCDNRDLSIFSHEILLRRQFPSSEVVLRNSMRRGHIHRLLITAALCIDITKGPKKGKITKNTQEQEKRSQSLLASIKKATTLSAEPSYQLMLKSMHGMCAAIAIFGAGASMESPLEPDSLENREGRATESLLSAEEQLCAVSQDLGTSSKPRIDMICSFLPDCMVPAFALCRMCVKVSEVYGWGPRKHKTKPCAAAVLKLSAKLLSLAEAIRSSLSCLPDHTLTTENLNLEPVMTLVDSNICESTLSTIAQGQTLTRLRVCKVLDEMLSVLRQIIDHDS